MLAGYMLLIASLTYKSFKAISYSEILTTPTGEPSNCIARISSDDNCSVAANLTSLLHPEPAILPDYLQLPASYHLPDLLLYVTASVLISEVSYHLICGVLQVYFYVLRRSSPEEWKCQPHRFLTKSNEIHEIVVGTANMILAGGEEASGVVGGHFSSLNLAIGCKNSKSSEYSQYIHSIFTTHVSMAKAIVFILIEWQVVITSKLLMAGNFQISAQI